MMHKRTLSIPGLVAAAFVLLSVAGGCGEGGVVDPIDTIPDDTTTPPPPPPPPVTVIAAGDIADCRFPEHELTAALVDANPNATVLALGDLVYPNGSASEFTNCYGSSWGRFKARTRPAIGNHEYQTPDANGYWGYFGLRAGPRDKGWYSYNLGAWHMVVLNSNYRYGVGVAPGSEQLNWLRQDLASNDRLCTMAYYHHPRFSSLDSRSSDTGLVHIWRELYENGVDLVLVGHDHLYERMAPANAQGNEDAAYGVRQFIIGTGGAEDYTLGEPLPISEARQNGTAGVLKLTLRHDGYSWQFLPIAGEDYDDSGSDDCHGPPPGFSAANARSALAILEPARYDHPRRASVRLPIDVFAHSQRRVARELALR